MGDAPNYSLGFVSVESCGDSCPPCRLAYPRYCVIAIVITPLEISTMSEGKKQQFNAPVGSVDNQGTQHNVAGVNYGIQTNTSDPELAATVQKIEALLPSGDKTQTITTGEQMTIAGGVISQIEEEPTFKERAIRAARGGLVEGLKQNPVGAIVAGAIEGWTKEKD